ncbi:6-carboxytetrahydropterin synthase [bacterium]|jgi:6-pyruvoyltetrahydropterin/6-carboxytetrahydropterin synthase|nr:6-carboxytetrahydropterin synthase [bacterium]
MYGVSVEDEFSSAHSITLADGRREAVHGHNWKVIVTVESELPGKTGMVCDFKDLKKALDSALKILDHKNLDEVEFFMENAPTAENIAKFIYDRMIDRLKLKRENILREVKVWETEGSSAFYRI